MIPPVKLNMGNIPIARFEGMYFKRLARKGP
jgi:hypothetical protein